MFDVVVVVVVFVVVVVAVVVVAGRQVLAAWGWERDTGRRGLELEMRYWSLSDLVLSCR